MSSEASPPLPPWRPIAIGDYVVPTQDKKHGLAGAWRWLRMHRTEGDGELHDPEPVPEDAVAHLVPGIDLHAAATALEEELEGWLESAPETHRSVALVGPPGSAVQGVMETWAENSEAVRLAAPSAAELDEGRWDPALPGDAGGRLVLPPLERLFLRRSGGLELLRGLLGRLQREGRSFACACDSWSWAYLTRTLRGRAAFDRTLAPAPFSGGVLRSWLTNLDPSVVFVEQKTGKPLLEEDGEPHGFLRTLAASSRGIPGVASGLWRLALTKARFGSAQNGVRRCMLPSWRDAAPPEMSQETGKPGALVLHALLLHGGLEERQLQAVLPLADADVRTLLWELNGRGIVTETDGTWRVSAIGYPAARSHLAGLNLPLDGF